MDNQTDIIPIFRTAAREVSGNTLEGLTLDTKISDLSLDSVSVMEIIGMVEEKLQMRFDDGDLSRLTTVRDLSVLVEKNRARS
jgi:acyl carrier protein